MFFGPKFFVVVLVGYLILKVVPQDTDSTSDDIYTSSSSSTTKTDLETSAGSTSSDLLSSTSVSETLTSTQMTATNVTANQSVLPTPETETTSASVVPTTLQTNTTLQANLSTTTSLVSSTTPTLQTASTNASASSPDTLATWSSTDFSTSSTNTTNSADSTSTTTATNISPATTTDAVTNASSTTTTAATNTSSATATAAATNTSLATTSEVTNTSLATTTSAVTNTSSATATAAATNASSDTTTATATNTSSATTTDAVTNASSTNTTRAATNTSTDTTTAAVTNTSSATTTAATNTSLATTSAATNTSLATTAAVTNTSLATTSAATNTSLATTAAVTNTSLATTTAATNTSLATTTAATNTSLATTSAATNTSLATTAAVTNTSLATTTSAVTNTSLATTTAAAINTSLAKTTSAVTNTSLATTRSAVTNTSLATTTAAAINTSLAKTTSAVTNTSSATATAAATNASSATTTARATTTTAATPQANLSTTTPSEAAQEILRAASKVNVSSANAQESIDDVLDTIDENVQYSISDDSALDNFTQAISIIVDKISKANWTQSERKNSSEKVLKTASTIMESLSAYNKQTKNYSSQDVDNTFSSLESSIFDLGATLTRSREKEYIGNDVLKVQYRSSRPEDLVDERTENGAVSLGLPDGLVNNFRTKSLLVTLMVYDKDVYTHALSTSKIVPSGHVAVVNVVDQDNNPVSAVSLGGPLTVMMPPTTFQPASANGTARADHSAFCSEAPPFTVLLLQFIVPAGRKLALLGHFGAPPTNFVYEFEATVTSDPHVTQSHDDITLVLQDGVAKVYVKRISRMVEKICFAAKYSDLLSESPRRRLLSSETAVMQAVRVSALSVVTWDNSQVAWTDNSRVSVRGIENDGRVQFKSNFIGKFSLSELVITPTEIDFSAIFLNFEQYLQNSPYVLSVICGVLLVSVFVTVLLRRLDVADSALWTYLPLTDNRADDTFVYTLSVHTSLNSPRHFTATPVFVLTGQFASTNTRLLADGVRENFQSGTVSNFVMTSQVNLGQLLVLNIWHDNKGNSPHWKLDRVVVVDHTNKEVALFVCRDWLSTNKSDGRTSRHLPVFMSDAVDGGRMFDVVSLHQLFDDHLWLSILKRLTYSRFTRVQRFLCAVALLFLAMVTDAMFFKGKEATYEKIRGVTIGSFQINYRQLYTGFVSGLIIIVPAVIMTWSFKHRETRGVNSRSRNVSPQSTSSRLLSLSSNPHPHRGAVFPLEEIKPSECLSTAQSTSTTKSENWEGRKMGRRFNRPKFFSSDPVSSTPVSRQRKSSRLHEENEKNDADIKYPATAAEVSTALPTNVTAIGEMSDIPIALNPSAVIQCTPAQRSEKELTFNANSLHPWWFIFVGYFFIFLSIVTGAFFCIMYSLEWGGSRSREWLLAVVFSSSTHALVIEPLKVILVSFILSSIFWHQAHDNIVEVAPYSLASRDTCNALQDHRTGPLSTGYEFSVCEDLEELESRHKDLKYNQRMHTILANLFFHALYLVLLYVLCHHISDNTSYIQNKAIERQLAAKKLKGNYSKSRLIDLPDETWDWVEKRFIPRIMSSYNCCDCANMETKSLLLSDGCNLRVGPVTMTQYRIKDICNLPPRIHKLLGTKHCKPSYSDHVEESGSFLPGWVVCTANCTETEYVYDTGGPTSMAQEGVVGVYGPGGFQASLGQTEYAVRKKVAELRRQKWLDQNTRALSIEVNLFNANTQLFTQARILLEFLTTGGCFWKTTICSARLYPYTSIWDYFVLVLQLVFIVIILLRVWRLFKGMCFPPDGHRCLESVIVKTFELLLSLVAIITYILRIDKTIYIVERIRNNPELHTSFDAAFFLDYICQVCLGICFFLQILCFLGPISFNYYIQLFRKTLLNSLSQLYGLSILLIVILSAFVSLIYLSCGAKNSQFKNILESYMTLNTLLLTITRYQDTEPEGADRQQLVFHYCAFGLYCFIASILVVNLAITILNSYLETTKKSTAMKDPRSYDGDLGKFVWRKLKKLWLSCTGSGTMELKKTSCCSANLSQATMLSLEWDYLDAKVDKLIDMLTRTVFHPSLEPRHVFHTREPNELPLHHRQHHQENEEQVKDSSKTAGIQPQVHTLQLRGKTLIRIMGKGQRLLYLLAISNASTKSDIKFRASGVSHKILHEVYDGKHALSSEAVQIFCAGSSQHNVEVGIPVLPYARQESCALAVKFTASEPWTYLPSVECSDLCTDFQVGFTWTRMQAVPRYLAAVICLAQKHPKGLILRQCPQCKFSTFDPTLLRNHLAVHSSRGLYMCRHPGCVAQFLERYQLIRHLKEKHNFPQVCHFCGEGFQSAHVLREHIRGHYIRPFKCDICGLQFLTPQQKDGHCFINHSDWKPKIHL